MKQLLFSATLVAFSAACSKSSPDNAKPSVLEVFVQTTLEEPVAGATVILYRTPADWQNQTNAFAALTTPSTGIAAFKDVQPTIYYIRITKDCQSNTRLPYQVDLSGLAAGWTQQFHTFIQSMGTLRWINTRPDSYRIEEIGQQSDTLPPAGSKDYPYTLIGHHYVRITQVTGFTYPQTPIIKDTVLQVSCGATTTYSF